MVADYHPYTPQYRTITGTGHTRPTQEIGAPTLIWHVAVWPRLSCDPQDAKPEAAEINVDKLGSERPPPSKDAYQDAVDRHNRRREEFLIANEVSDAGRS